MNKNMKLSKEKEKILHKQFSALKERVKKQDRLIYDVRQGYM
jgi:hypothetical protein